MGGGAAVAEGASSRGEVRREKWLRRVGAGDISPSEGLGVVKVVQRGGGGAGESWRRSGGAGGGGSAAAAGRDLVRCGQDTLCARSRRVPGRAVEGREGESNKIRPKKKKNGVSTLSAQ